MVVSSVRLELTLQHTLDAVCHNSIDQLALRLLPHPGLATSWPCHSSTHAGPSTFFEVLMPTVAGICKHALSQWALLHP